MNHLFESALHWPENSTFGTLYEVAQGSLKTFFFFPSEARNDLRVISFFLVVPTMHWTLSACIGHIQPQFPPETLNISITAKSLGGSLFRGRLAD